MKIKITTTATATATATASRLKPVPLGDRDFTVGAGLLANAFCQSVHSYLIHRVRQQAGSYRKNAFCQVRR
jgi:hypothetical protein